ncbi:MAG: aminopeptidase [Phycisphaerae bacterium]|nr:aminopeptidase [Phycisphaerae bacterium]
MGTLEEGVRQAIDNCLKVKKGDKVVVITDRESLEIGSGLRAAAEKKAGTTARFFIMEDFGQRPIPFPQEIKEALVGATVSIYAAQGAKGELQTFRRPMLSEIDANAKLRHGHMIGITRQIMEDGMCSDYTEIQRISKLVYEKVKNARSIRVTTDKGCDFTAEFSPDLKWIISDGAIKPKHWSNLPDGEVFTCPATLNGQVVIDGCLGDFFTEKYASIEETPIRVQVKDGRADRATLQCKNEALLKEYGNYVFESDENSNRVGEFAIGTNTGLTHLIYNLLQDEKFPGVHIAFGSSYPTKTGATWDSKTHVDGVLRSPSIYVDGEAIMTQGQFHL